MEAEDVRRLIARRAAQDVQDGMVVNLGIGIPTLVADLVPADREIIYHSENGLIGFGPAPEKGREDPDLINASKDPVTLLAGAAVCDSLTAFSMMRGGHIDLALMGAYQVSADGSLANWTLGREGVPPGVGGAMDLAVGSRNLWALMNHSDKNGAPRIVRELTLPITTQRRVTRIYTEKAVIDVTPSGLVARERFCPVEELVASTGAPIDVSGV
ncbi:MAG: 3-oxoacid CoA-transferase subunit B [Mesorhizobium sp.]